MICSLFKRSSELWLQVLTGKRKLIVTLLCCVRTTISDTQLKPYEKGEVILFTFAARPLSHHSVSQKSPARGYLNFNHFFTNG